MYLSTNNCNELHNVVKGFEVAYRSLISDRLVSNFNDYDLFKCEVNKMQNRFDVLPVIGFAKYKSKIDCLSSKLKEKYKILTLCKQAYVESNCSCNEVPYVSEILDYLLIFFNPLFVDLARDFDNIEDFASDSLRYLKIRNDLSHPASAKISIATAKEVVLYIKRLIIVIDDKYFWYHTIDNLLIDIDNFLFGLNDNPLKFHNLSDVAVSHKKLLCREAELNKLRELIIPDNEYCRSADSVVVYGYGGVGKTAIVTEFLHSIVKDIKDSSLTKKIDFLLFFTSKEEKLSNFDTTGKLYIENIRRQITSFDDFEKSLNRLLLNNNAINLSNLTGIIVVDNFENLPIEDKSKFIEFIRITPRSVKFIITSRNEEARCEGRLYIEEFKDYGKGMAFIDEYIIEQELSLLLDEAQKENLLCLSKGNALILVLSLQNLNNGKHSYSEIVSQLENVASKNMEAISDFMYKNTLNETMAELVEKKYSPTDVIKIISLYEEPVDIHTVSVLSGRNIREVEDIFDIFTRKLILVKSGEVYELNEFANRFIFIKYLPDRVEISILKEKIANYKTEINKKLDNLIRLKRKYPNLNTVMQDWKPSNYTDEIAIADAFNLYYDAKDIINAGNLSAKDEIQKKLDRSELITPHPYIKIQKVEIYELYLSKKFGIINDNDIEKLITQINNIYEDVIERIDLYFQHLKSTSSYALLLWRFSHFLIKYMEEYPRALRYLEMAQSCFTKIPKNKIYYSIGNTISQAYKQLYNETGNSTYLKLLKVVYADMKEQSKSSSGKASRFKFDYYLKNFKEYGS